jgi:hypothetical protein
MADATYKAILPKISSANKARPWMTTAQLRFVQWRDSIEADGWVTPDTYGREFASFGNFPAVYLFNRMGILDDYSFVVAYVGMSTNLAQRMTGHPILTEISTGDGYVQRWFKQTPRDLLRDVERHYIQKFNPPWNIIGKKRGLNLQ